MGLAQGMGGRHRHRVGKGEGIGICNWWGMAGKGRTIAWQSSSNGKGKGTESPQGGKSTGNSLAKVAVYGIWAGKARAGEVSKAGHSPAMWGRRQAEG